MQKSHKSGSKHDFSKNWRKQKFLEIKFWVKYTYHRPFYDEKWRFGKGGQIDPPSYVGLLWNPSYRIGLILPRRFLFALTRWRPRAYIYVHWFRSTGPGHIYMSKNGIFSKSVWLDKEWPLQFLEHAFKNDFMSSYQYLWKKYALIITKMK